MMLEELQSRNYSTITTRNYLRVVADFARYFGKSPTTAGLQLLCTRRNRNVPSSLREFYPLAVPALRRGHDRDSEIYRCGVINMRLLRFFVALSSVAPCRRALARRSIRVFPPCRHALTQLSARTLAGQCSTGDDLHAAYPVRRWPSSSRLGTKLPFKPHNSTRPPQTPAASS